MRKNSFISFALGFGTGTLVGFLLRNSETADYNAGYQPKANVFDESDYFTEEICTEHEKEKAARKKQKATKKHEDDTEEIKYGKVLE